MMALLIKCWACVGGDHKHCLVADSTRQDGVMGGWRCNCDCRRSNVPDDHGLTPLDIEGEAAE